MPRGRLLANPPKVTAMTHRLLLVALLAAVVSPALAKDAPAQERVFPVRVAVDAAGQVTGVVPQGEIPAALQVMVMQAADQAEFEPAQVNGEPVPSLTGVSVKVRLTGLGDDYRAEVIELTSAGGTLHGSVPPKTVHTARSSAASLPGVPVPCRLR